MVRRIERVVLLNGIVRHQLSTQSISNDVISGGLSVTSEESITRAISTAP